MFVTRVRSADKIRARSRHTSTAHLAQLQFRLRALVCAEVHVDAVHLRLAVCIALHDVAGEHRHAVAILVAEQDLAGGNLDPVLDPVAVQGLDIDAQLGGNQHVVERTAKHLLGLNEPERDTQGNLTVEEAMTLIRELLSL